MAAKVVHDHHIAPAEGRGQGPYDIDLEDLAVDRAVDEHWCGDAAQSQTSDEGGGLPVPRGKLARNRSKRGRTPTQTTIFMFSPFVIKSIKRIDF